MSRPRILFRADASHALGFGHVARICALVEEAEAQGYDAHALFAGDATAIKSWARDRKLTVDVRDWSATQVVQAAEHPLVRAVVVDGPPLADALVPKLPVRVRAVMIDDRGRCALPVASVVNHNIHAPELAASYPGAHQRLLGRRYLMLRRDIRRYMRGSCRPDPNCARLRVLVTFGGSDPVGATARTLRLLPPDRPLDVVVITGPGFRDDQALRDAIAIAKQAGHDIDVRRAPDDPGALFVSADAAISSAGGTLGELAYLGCPALAYAIVPDQIVAARQQVREGLIAGGRRLDEATDDVVRGDILAFVLDDAGRLTQRKRALATADSEGPRRIIEETLTP
jgi:spore coat polysaccharide biosynthesis predicted glycosyltransferase SpsG